MSAYTGSTSFEEFATGLSLINEAMNQETADLVSATKDSRDALEQAKAEYAAQEQTAAQKADEAQQAVNDAQDLVNQYQSTYNSLSSDVQQLVAQQQEADEQANAATAAQTVAASAAAGAQAEAAAAQNADNGGNDGGDDSGNDDNGGSNGGGRRPTPGRPRTSSIPPNSGSTSSSSSRTRFVLEAHDHRRLFQLDISSSSRRVSSKSSSKSYDGGSETWSVAPAPASALPTRGCRGPFALRLLGPRELRHHRFAFPRTTSSSWAIRPSATPQPGDVRALGPLRHPSAAVR